MPPPLPLRTLASVITRHSLCAPEAGNARSADRQVSAQRRIRSCGVVAVGLKRRLSQAGQDALERLELPVNLAAGVARIELLGNRELYMDRHRGVLAYTTEEVAVNGGDVVVRVRGADLQLVVMTEQELRITGKIAGIELVE